MHPITPAIDQKIFRLKAQVEESQATIVDYRDALDKANNNIEEANSNIENAKSNAWESYDGGGDALDSLSTVETIRTP